MTPLPIIYDGVQQPALDIVSIPGLPALSPQYKSRDQNAWLREVLSHQIPRARIMAFHYDFGKTGVLSWRILLEEAISLLLSLVIRREGVEKRPIVFVCSSFGSYILKKVLLVAKEEHRFRSILESTRGVVFLGCHHNEDDPKFEELCLKCAAVEFGLMRKHDVVEGLRKAEDWHSIKEVMEQFRRLNAPFQVRGFFELHPTMYHLGRFSVVRKAECLCPQQVASLHWESERMIGVNANHEQITTYPHRGDEHFFDIFMTTLSDLIDEVCPIHSVPAFSSSEESSTPHETWISVQDMAASISSLSVISEPQLANSILAIGAQDSTVPKVNIPSFVVTPYEKNPGFVGRVDILEEIHGTLVTTDDSSLAQQTFVLAGLGGMGKTQIAIEYAYRYRDKYQVILFAHADGQAKLAESFCLFATELNLEGSKKLSPQDAKEAVKECLGALDVDWLLIIDNADGDDKEELIREYRPQSDRGSLLITSRDFRLIAQLGGIELTVLDEESAVALLLATTRFDGSKLDEEELEEEMEAARMIVKRIDYLPLGINQAANLILNDSCSFSEFFEAYSNRELIEDSDEVRLVSHGSTYQYSLRTVWNMNFDRLTDDSQSLIKLMSFLDPDRVQLKLLADGVTKSKMDSLSFISTPYKRNKCKVALLRSSLVTQSEKHKELRMHRLVQASCQLRMDLSERRQSFKNALNIVKQCWPVPPRVAIYDPALWDEQQALLPHVQSLCAHYVASCREGKPLIAPETVDWDFASILYEAGWYCYERAMLGLINDLLLPAEEYCLRHIDKGGGYRILSDIYGGIGSLYTESNMFLEAYQSFQKEWDYIKLAFDSGELQRPSIWEVFGLARLGNGLHGLNKYEEAEQHYYRALSAWEGLPGDRTVYTTNLAICLWLQGRLEDSEKRLLPLIKDRGDTTNFRTGYALLALGNVQISQAQALTAEGRKEDAETKFNEAMETHLQSSNLYSSTIGPKHHRTADTFHKVGWHLHRKCEYAAALLMMERALEVYDTNSDHLKNEIARTRYKRGCIYQDMGEREKGSAEIREAEKLRKTIVPPEDWQPARGEEDFDRIVQFWSR